MKSRWLVENKMIKFLDWAGSMNKKHHLSTVGRGKNTSLRTVDHFSVAQLSCGRSELLAIHLRGCR